MTKPAVQRAFLFSDLRIDLAAREIRRGGVPQPVQPKAFELLVCLIENRHRVVTKEELLDRVWPDLVVTENVIARAVMKAREAIGDTADPPEIIRTVQRVGYRFFEGSVPPAARHAPQAEDAAPPAGPTDQNSVRIAFLPMDNRIADAQYAWVPLGLSSLVAQAFELDDRFAVVPVATMLQALDTLPATATPDERAETLVRHLGAQCVVSCIVRRQAAATFSIEYRGAGSRGAGLRGRIDGSHLTALGQQLADLIGRHALPQNDSPVLFESADALVNQTLACALQARLEQRYAAAIKLVEVVLDIEPRNTAALLLRLQLMMHTLDPRVQAFGEQLLQHAEAIRSPHMAAQTHASMAMSSLILQGPVPATLHHADEALQRVGEGRNDASALRVYGICAVIAQAAGDDARARRWFEHCIEQQALAGDHYTRILNLTNLAMSDVLALDFEKAGERWTEVFQFQRDCGLNEAAVCTLGNVASVEAQTGRWTKALEHCDEALRLLARSTVQPKTLLPIASICVIYAEWSRVDSIDLALDLAGDLPAENGQQLHAALLTVRAHRLVAQGAFEAARAPLQTVLGLHRQAGAVTYLRQAAAWFLRNEMRAGHFGAACAAAEELLAAEPGLRAETEVEGLRLHAQAARLHALGDAAGAAKRLANAIDLLPVGLPAAMARLDAAWLAIERGDLAHARARLAGVPAWAREHPLGVAAAARLMFAECRFRDAVAGHQASVGSTALVAPYLLDLQAFYVRAPTSRHATLPRAPRLLSMLPTGRRPAEPPDSVSGSA